MYQQNYQVLHRKESEERMAFSDKGGNMEAIRV